MWHTFNIVQLWVQSEAYFRATYAHELVLVVLSTAELANNIPQDVVLAWTYELGFCGDEMMDREDVCHLDIKCWLRFGVKVVEFVNIELSLSIGNINY